MNQNQPPVSATQSGKVYRMGRIFGPDGKTVVLPLDHGTMLGRVSGLEDPVAALESFLSTELRRLPDRPRPGFA